MISDHVLVWFLLMINNDSCLVSVNLSIPKKIPWWSYNRDRHETDTWELWSALYATDQDMLWPTLARCTFTSTLSFMDVIIRSHHGETMMAVCKLNSFVYSYKSKRHNVWLPRLPVQSSSGKSCTRSSPSKLRRNKRWNLSPKTSIATRRLPGFPKTWIT